MSSPTVTAIDFILVSLGLAPLKILGDIIFKRRRKKMDRELRDAIEDLNKKEK